MRRLGLAAWMTMSMLATTVSGMVYAASFYEGQHYKAVKQGQDSDPSQVEVVEFFMYSCPHCYHLETDALQWKNNKAKAINFRRVPVVFNPKFESHAQAYFTAEALGVLETIHPAMFHAFHEEGNYLESQAKIKALFIKYGVDADEFDKTYSSFAVKTKLRRAKAEAAKMRINSVPTLVVDGVYWTQVGMGGERNPFNVVDALIEQRQ